MRDAPRLDPAGTVAHGTPVPVRTATRGAFTVSEAGITWRCASCGTVNPIDVQVCAVCGVTFADLMNPKPARVERDPNTVALYSLFFPGAGHWYLQMRGQAIARAVLSVWVVLVAVIGGVIGSRALAIPFGIAAFALWILAAHDAYREAQGDSRAVILKGRSFVYLVMGLLMLMIVLLVAAGVQAG